MSDGGPRGSGGPHAEDLVKKCPMCAEMIQDEAIKCRYCGEFLQKPAGEKWYFKKSFLIIALLSLGPFALPLIWWHPQFSRRNKLIITAAVIAATVVCSIAIGRAVQALWSYYGILFAV